MTQNADDLIKDAESAEVKGDRARSAQRSKTSGLAVNQQAAQISKRSATASYGDGEALALQEAEGLVMGYVQTSQAVTEVVATQIEQARQGFSAAIRSASSPVRSEGDREAFLTDFGARLSSLTGSLES